MSTATPDDPDLRLLIAQLHALDAWAAWVRERDAELASRVVTAGPDGVQAITDELVYNGLERQGVLARIDADEVTARAATSGPTAVLAVRQGWTSEMLTQHLQRAGLFVLSVVRDGPSATAAVLTGQPTLVVAEDAPGLLDVPRLIDRTQRFAPATNVCLLTDRPAVAPATSPGAGVTVLSRRHDPAAVAARAVRCLSS